MMIPIGFSVIIPTFNRAKQISELLDSLRLQKYTNFEVIICDDGSTDNTKSVVDKFKSVLDIKYLYASNWGGPARPRNLGIQNASKEWICFLDSDDLWFPEKLEKIAEVIDQQRSIDVICHLFKNNVSNLPFGNYKKSIFYNQHTDFLINGNAIINSSLTIKKEILVKVNGLSEDIRLIGVEDYDLLIRLAKFGAKIYLLKKILGIYRINDTNISADHLEQVNKIKHLLSIHSIGLNRWYNTKIEGLLDYLKVTYFLKVKDFKQANNFLVKSIIKGSINIKFKAILKIIKATFSK